MKHAVITIKGRVQGVYFRAHTRDVAIGLGLRGTVKNLTNGNVEIIAEGEEDKLEELVRWAKKGSPASKVDNIFSDFSDTLQGYENFEIIYI